jgi:chromate transporter
VADLSRPRRGFGGDDDSTRGARLVELARLFLRLAVTSFGGPAAHIALIQRECVERRQWITPQRFIDLLGVSSLIPGPTSTELAMHVGHQRAGWPGLVVAGLAFILPAAVCVGILAAVYVRAGDLQAIRGVLAAVQPVVIVIVLQAIVPLARSALRSVPLVMVALAVVILALAGAPELRLLLAAGLVTLVLGTDRSQIGRATSAPVIVGVIATVIAGASVAALAAAATHVAAPAVFTYFVRVGSLLFGSGYVLLSILHGDLVEQLRWLTERELLDAVAAGQATPGPVFTTATFIGYLLGGAPIAAAATIGIFLPAFVCTALSAMLFDRIRSSRHARAFLDGVNAAAVALIAVVLVSLGQAAFTGPMTIVIAAAAAVSIFAFRLSSALVLAVAAAGGLLVGLVRP